MWMSSTSCSMCVFISLFHNLVFRSASQVSLSKKATFSSELSMSDTSTRISALSIFLSFRHSPSFHRVQHHCLSSKLSTIEASNHGFFQCCPFHFPKTLQSPKKGCSSAFFNTIHQGGRDRISRFRTAHLERCHSLPNNQLAKCGKRKRRRLEGKNASIFKTSHSLHEERYRKHVEHFDELEKKKRADDGGLTISFPFNVLTGSVHTLIRFVFDVFDLLALGSMIYFPISISAILMRKFPFRGVPKL